MTPHRFRSFVLVAAVALSLAGCAFYAPVGPGAHAIQGKLDVTLDSTWNRQVDGASNIWPETWTRNGPLLDTVHLAPGMDASEAELQAWVRQRLAGFKVPVRIVFCAETLPRNANGKIMKRDLKALFD